MENILPKGYNNNNNNNNNNSLSLSSLIMFGAVSFPSLVTATDAVRFTLRYRAPLIFSFCPLTHTTLAAGSLRRPSPATAE